MEESSGKVSDGDIDYYLKKAIKQINRKDAITADEMDNKLETNKTVYLYTSIGHNIFKE